MTSLTAPASLAPPFAAATRAECSWSRPPIDLARETWDAIVIGAGPAGAASAYLLARRGWRVLLLERSSWPREKPCGGCLSASAVACLESTGLSHILRHANPIRSCSLHQGGSQVRLAVEDTFAIRRSELDAGIVAAFTSQGGAFVHGASAVVESDSSDDVRRVRVGVEGELTQARGRLILACDGLSGSSLANEPWARWTVAPGAYVGVATSVETQTFDVHESELHMHIGACGYVGAVRHGENEVHLAAALDPQQTRALGPAGAVESILKSCERRIATRDLKFKGVPTLTRHRQQLGGQRVLAVGDACGYIEPFTGEGIAWALRSAIEVASLVQDEWDAQTPKRWQTVRHQAIGQKQNICRAVRLAVRKPVVARAAIEFLRHVPQLARWISQPRQVQA